MHTWLIYLLKKSLFIGDSFVQFPSSYTCQTCGNAFWREESLPRHQITCHLPFCPACRPSATTAARTSQETPGSLSTCWRSMKLAAPLKILHERYMATLIKHRRISFAICYITFKTRISFKEHMRGAHLLAPGPAGVEGRFVREIMLLLDVISVGGTKHKRERGFTSVMSVPTPNQHKL